MACVCVYLCMCECKEREREREREKERERSDRDEVLSAAQINNRLNLSVDVEELKNFATHQLLPWLLLLLL